jgi:mannose-6-phosphate isomerase-like protein (cupin superfamily)
VNANAWPEFPGAVGISDLAAYPWPTVDGEHGGSPHVHLVCAEAYVVVSGRGRLQTLNRSGPGMQTLSPGDVVWFTPGTIHRALNDGDLHVLVIMQNSGLPEAGDAVMTFPAVHLTPERYSASASVLGPDGAPSAERARQRRDLAVEGFTELLSQWNAGDHAALDAFYRRALDVVTPRLGQWRAIVEDGALSAVLAALEHIDALGRQDTAHLAHADVSRVRPAETTFGMCGFLHPYQPARP